MWLRLISAIVPSVCALALVAHGYPASSSGHPIPIRDGHAKITRIVDAHAETVGHAVISALIAGQVTSIEVHNNEHVSRGQVLFRIDDRPYQLAVEVAQANIAIPRHRVVALRAVYRQHLAGLAAAQDVLVYQRRMHDKQTQLLSKGTISRLEFDRATAAFLDARERVLAEQCAIAETLADLDNDPDLPIDRHPAVERAKAELDRAELDLSHAVVTAPEDGIVTNVDRLRVGEYVQVGAAVFDLASERIASRS
jgi:membrane fusion protein, multidrug efflux system